MDRNESVSNIYGSVFDYALEAAGHTIDADLRDSLDDSDFGIPDVRKYPLRVPGNKKLTKELVAKAVQMFHYCKPEWKKQLAENIIKIIKSEGLDIKISRKSQINKYVTVPEKNLAD